MNALAHAGTIAAAALFALGCYMGYTMALTDNPAAFGGYLGAYGPTLCGALAVVALRCAARLRGAA